MTSPYFPRSPWFSPAGNAKTETDLRTGAQPLGFGDPSHSGPPDAVGFRAAPNPFATSSVFRYALAAREHVELTIYDVQGRAVRTLVNGTEVAGPHAVAWDGRNDAGVTLSPGVYLARLSVGETVRAEKLVRDW
jgi:hypothetical protein